MLRQNFDHQVLIIAILEHVPFQYLLLKIFVTLQTLETQELYCLDRQPKKNWQLNYRMIISQPALMKKNESSDVVEKLKD